jgi:hypothetical protein
MCPICVPVQCGCYLATVANRWLLLFLAESAPPSEYEPSGATRGSNYSVPLYWLSMFDRNSMVKWPCTLDPTSTYTALVGDIEDCTVSSRARVEAWRSEYGHEVGIVTERWLSTLESATAKYVAVWTEEISDMSGDDLWAQSLCSYLDGLDDTGSEGFRVAARQSFLDIDTSGKTLRGSGGTPLDVALTGYPWA